MATDFAELERQLGQIEDVNGSTWYYIWHYHRVAYISAVIASLVGSAALVALAYRIFGTNPVIFSLVFTPAALIAVLHEYYRSQVQHVFIRELAIALGFTYAAEGDMSTVVGVFFRMGHDQSITDVMTGRYQEKLVQMYSYQMTIGYGKNSHTYQFTIFELDHGSALPHVLMNKDQFPEALGEWSTGLEAVRLEGDFNDIFSLYVEKGKQMEVREIFQPDVMQDIMGAEPFSMEISGTKVYLIRKGAFSSKGAFITLLRAAARMYEEIAAGLVAVDTDPATTVP